MRKYLTDTEIGVMSGLLAIAAAAVLITVINEASPASGPVDLDVEMVRLVALYDGPDINIVDAEIILTASRNTAVSFEGDVRKEAVHRNSVKFLEDGVIIHHQGLLWLTEPKAVGDTVDIIMLYGDDGRAVKAVLERP